LGRFCEVTKQWEVWLENTPRAKRLDPQHLVAAVEPAGLRRAEVKDPVESAATAQQQIPEAIAAEPPAQQAGSAEPSFYPGGVTHYLRSDGVMYPLGAPLPPMPSEPMPSNPAAAEVAAALPEAEVKDPAGSVATSLQPAPGFDAKAAAKQLASQNDPEKLLEAIAAATEAKKAAAAREAYTEAAAFKAEADRLRAVLRAGQEEARRELADLVRRKESAAAAEDFLGAQMFKDRATALRAKYEL